jgi:hypothetical protein
MLLLAAIESDPRPPLGDVTNNEKASHESLKTSCIFAADPVSEKRFNSSNMHSPRPIKTGSRKQYVQRTGALQQKKTIEASATHMRHIVRI